MTQILIDTEEDEPAAAALESATIPGAWDSICVICGELVCVIPPANDRIARMTTWRLVLVIIGLSFVGFGAAFIAYPVDMTRLVSIVLIDATAITDVRATYGGMEFGIGVFFLACALRRDFVRIGLFAAACVLVAMATARAVGLMLDGFWQPLELLITVIESVGGFVATWGALVAKPAGTIAPPVPSSHASQTKPAPPSSSRS